MGRDRVRGIRRVAFVALSLLLLLFLPPPVLGQARDLYPTSVLSESRATYAPKVRWNLRNTIFPLLRPSERLRLGAVRLEMPLRHPRDPFAYLSGNNPPVVLLSVASLKFLDDLILALVWLDDRGHSTGTVVDYLSRLKYRNGAGLEGVDPLSALAVPVDAYDDEDVNQTAINGLNSAVMFILGHELGHLAYGHGLSAPGSAAVSREWEREADAFALELFRRMGVAPLGASVFFLAATYLSRNEADFPDAESWHRYVRYDATHPLSGSRLRAVAEGLRTDPCDFLRYEGGCNRVTAVRQVANELDSLGGFLDDRDLQQVAAMRARNSVLSALRPQPPGTLLPRIGDPVEGGVPFRGRFRGVMQDSSGAAPVEIELYRAGDRVTGRFSYGLGEGWLLGRIEGTSLVLRWGLGDREGRGRLELDGERLRGTLGTDDSRTNLGSWILEPDTTRRR